MNQIKSAVDNKQTLCVGCLSVDRKLFKLNNTELYYSLLGEQYVNELKCWNLELCWECVALLNRITLFQRRIQNAQIILRSLDRLKRTKLSTLSIKHKDYYDVTIEYEEEESKNVDYNVTNEIIDVIPCTAIKQEITEVAPEQKIEDLKEENLEELFTEDDRYSDMDMYDRDVSLKEKEKKKKVFKRKCEKSVKITINDIDLDNFGQYFNGGLCKGYEEQKRKRKSLNDAFPGECAVRSCKLCGLECRTRAEQLRHLKHHHQNSYGCKVCGCSYNTMREFSKHYKELHELLFCDHCGKKFVKRRSIETHIRRHHMPRVCRECDRTYTTYHALDNHNRMCHPGAKSSASELAYCVECDKQYPSVYKYRRHLATGVRHIAPKRLSIPCPECGKVFTRKAYMNNHYRLFHIKKSKHHCQLCDKYFITGYTLRKHVAYVHDKLLQPRNKICEVCGRGFSTNRVLVNHMRTHTGERPFRCTQCAAAFAQRTALRTHARALHGTDAA